MNRTFVVTLLDTIYLETGVLVCWRIKKMKA